MALISQRPRKSAVRVGRLSILSFENDVPRIEFHSNVIDSNVDDDTTAQSLAGTMIKTVTKMEKEP